jgi:hypothetical protein
MEEFIALHADRLAFCEQQLEKLSLLQRQQSSGHVQNDERSMDEQRLLDEKLLEEKVTQVLAKARLAASGNPLPSNCCTPSLPSSSCTPSLSQSSTRSSLHPNPTLSQKPSLQSGKTTIQRSKSTTDPTQQSKPGHLSTVQLLKSGHLPPIEHAKRSKVQINNKSATSTLSLPAISKSTATPDCSLAAGLKKQYDLDNQPMYVMQLALILLI